MGASSGERASSRAARDPSLPSEERETTNRRCPGRAARARGCVRVNCPPTDGRAMTRSRRKERLVWLSTVILVTLLAAVKSVRVWWPASPMPTAPQIRFEMAMPAGGAGGHDCRTRARVSGDLARRAKDGLRIRFDGTVSVVVAPARFCVGATADGNRGRGFAVLVAG